MSSTLIDLRKQAGLTNKQIGQATGCSVSTVGNILHGTHMSTYSDEDIQRLATVLGVTFERCRYAMCESANQRYCTPGKQHIRASEVQMQAETILKAKMPDLAIEVSTPRPFATIEAISLIGEECVDGWNGSISRSIDTITENFP